MILSFSVKQNKTSILLGWKNYPLLWLDLCEVWQSVIQGFPISLLWIQVCIRLKPFPQKWQTESFYWKPERVTCSGPLEIFMNSAENWFKSRAPIQGKFLGFLPPGLGFMMVFSQLGPLAHKMLLALPGLYFTLQTFTSWTRTRYTINFSPDR